MAENNTTPAFVNKPREKNIANLAAIFLRLGRFAGEGDEMKFVCPARSAEETAQSPTCWKSIEPGFCINRPAPNAYAATDNPAEKHTKIRAFCKELAAGYCDEVPAIAESFLEQFKEELEDGDITGRLTVADLMKILAESDPKAEVWCFVDGQGGGAIPATGAYISNEGEVIISDGGAD